MKGYSTSPSWRLNRGSGTAIFALHRINTFTNTIFKTVTEIGMTESFELIRFAPPSANVK
jgi:hypothetical protein